MSRESILSAQVFHGPESWETQFDYVRVEKASYSNAHCFGGKCGGVTACEKECNATWPGIANGNGSQTAGGGIKTD